MNEAIYSAGPAKKAFANPHFREPEHLTLDNGVPVYSVLSDQTETLKVEWVFEAGSIFADKVMQAAAAAELLNKGTALKSGFELNEQLDVYGSFFSAESTRDEITLRLFTLKRFFAQVLPIVAEMVNGAVYPDDEFAVWLDAKRNAYSVNSQKTDYQASARFPSVLFGEGSQYGIYVRPEHFDALTADDARRYHQRLLKSPFKIFVSGCAPADWRLQLNDSFGYLKPEAFDAQTPFDFTVNTPNELRVFVPGSVQHSLAIGRKLWLRDLDTYTPFMVMNTALGGYFGSRLMGNLREKHGYTYGVGSGLSRMRFADTYKISTDVGAEVSEAARKAIFHEVEVLQNELLPADELQRVKTYMGGSFLRSFDGPQAIMDRFKSLIQHGLPLDFFERYAERIPQITADEVRSSAGAYLGGLKTVVAGAEL